MTGSDWTAESVFVTTNAEGVDGINLVTASGTQFIALADLTFEADWGDNVEEGQQWVDGRFVRVELAVYADLPGDLTMTGLEMVNLVELYPDEDWDGAKEIWVTTGDMLEYDKVLVYDPLVSMTISAPDQDDIWTEGDWGSEINQSGKVIYGSLWDTADDGYTADGLVKVTVEVDFSVIPDDVAQTFSQEINLVAERMPGPPEGGDAPDHAGPGGDSGSGGGGGNAPTDPGQGGGGSGGQGGPPQNPEGVDDEPGQGGGNAPTDPGQGGSDDSGNQGGSGGSGGNGGSGGAGTVPDNDGDGFANNEDNCVEVANPDQADADDDGIGDVCDPDPDVPGEPVEEDGPPEGRGGGAPDVTGPPEGSGPGSDHDGEHEDDTHEGSGS